MRLHTLLFASGYFVKIYYKSQTSTMLRQEQFMPNGQFKTKSINAQAIHFNPLNGLNTNIAYTVNRAETSPIASMLR